MDSVNIPFDSHKIDLDKKKKNRERFKEYYSKNKEKFLHRNKENYEKRKEGLTEEELKRRRADNIRSYYHRKELKVRNELLELKEKAREDRQCLIDEILSDNDYSNFGKETLYVIALLTKKKETEISNTNEGTEGTEGTEATETTERKEEESKGGCCSKRRSRFC